MQSSDLMEGRLSLSYIKSYKGRKVLQAGGNGGKRKERMVEWGEVLRRSQFVEKLVAVVC